MTFVKLDLSIFTPFDSNAELITTRLVIIVEPRKVKLVTFRILETTRSTRAIIMVAKN